MVGAFALVALIQQWIDAGQRPNIIWQILAYALLTVAEVMVSIVALEFAYTQSPRTMKSLIMCLYLASVAVGNYFVYKVNRYIQIPDSAAIQLEEATAKLPADWRKDPRTVCLPGYDGVTGTQDDIIVRLEKGEMKQCELPQSESFEKLLRAIMDTTRSGNPLPKPEQLNAAFGASLGNDPWGNPIRYQRLNHRTARLISNGPDRQPNTRWDMGYLLTVDEPAPASKPSWTDRLHPETPWLERRKQELGIQGTSSSEDSGGPLKAQAFIGGHTKLHGAEYFNFFTWLMFGTAIAFIPYAMLYRPKTWLQE
jgi:POT family proton-dependent oligopeptide transporter